MSSLRLAVVGGGVAGRLLALRAAREGLAVTLYDASPRDGVGSCTAVGAGMLAPCCELEHADGATARLGEDAPDRWRDLCAELSLAPALVRQDGSLVVAHPRDEAEMRRLARAVEQEPWARANMRAVDAARIQELEPALEGRFRRGLHFPGEGAVDNDAFLAETTRALENAPKVRWLSGTRVEAVGPGAVVTAEGRQAHDAVADCRGLGARADWPGLRGVRGELVHVESSDVVLRRPVRLMHPRYPLYVVPRDHGRFVIGATVLESEDAGAVTVQSALELLSAAFAVHPAFGEARIVSWRTACRPALPHHQPRLRHRPGWVALNGLHRHGFLLSPVLTEAALRLLLGREPDPRVVPFVLNEG